MIYAKLLTKLTNNWNDKLRKRFKNLKKNGLSAYLQKKINVPFMFSAKKEICEEATKWKMKGVIRAIHVINLTSIPSSFTSFILYFSQKNRQSFLLLLLPFIGQCVDFLSYFPNPLKFRKTLTLEISAMKTAVIVLIIIFMDWNYERMKKN